MTPPSRPPDAAAEVPPTTADDASTLPGERTIAGRDLVGLATCAGATVLVMFLIWEVIELWFASTDTIAHLFHYSRGISTSLTTGLVVAALLHRQHARRAELLEREVSRRTQESREARRLTQLVVDATPASLMVIDEDHHIVQANRTAEQVHGQALTGASCREIVGDPCRCGDCPAVASLQAGVMSKAGGLHQAGTTGEILEVESHPLELDDGRRYALLVERVVTERKKLEARVLHQEKMAAFGLFAAEVAHDLGNPLSSIDTQLQLIDDASLPPDAGESIVLVRGEVRRLHRILRELVSFARKRRDETTLVSTVTVVEDTLRLLRHDRRMRRVSVVRDFDLDAPPVLIVEDHLMQVIMNLIMNALDAMTEGGELRVEIHPVGDDLALRIHDTGSGMEQSVLDRCLEPLFTTKAEGKGTGLGLSIARDIVEAAGGTLELHSAVGRGTTAILTLPAAVEATIGRLPLEPATASP